MSTSKLKRYTKRGNGEYMVNRTVTVTIPASAVDQIIQSGLATSAKPAEDLLIKAIIRNTAAYDCLGLSIDEDGDLGNHEYDERNTTLDNAYISA